MRLYARLALPDEWKVPGADFPVNDAKLVINHWITNNPNDQLRPEDLENETATGRKPSYRIEGGRWKSLVSCYEGDGDAIDTEEGSIDPHFIGVGTVLKNPSFGFTGLSTLHDLYSFSEDLKEGFTNAWYTTINRDPFEWSYDANPDPDVQDFVGSPVPDDSLGELVSGPRWRLKPNKFGQDLPGLEIPKLECSQPPFERDNIKYVVGEPTTTIINLLDWDESNGPSPLSSSKGWVDHTANNFIEVIDEVNGTPVTSNGLPMSDDFDLAVYVKGDRKPTAIFTATLLINEEEEPPVGEADVKILNLNVPNYISTGKTRRVILDIINDRNAQAVASGQVIVSNNVQGVVFSAEYMDLSQNSKEKFRFDWTAPDVETVVIWEAKVFVSGTEVDLETGVTTVR